ncbi:hypothetical protein LC613_08535 [Nostoc sphaeroides CHAB 2801]|uniref:hypothetical protein n=1 Tax=Nostoc sphaeroides TaxID=446679 RepID=UPI0015F34212|nr:hypothetical protein [Nostoc sphaeroides]MCC5628164.1 hypothetical protein [Nostoc sphaeroides CHAB 2801]
MMVHRLAVVSALAILSAVALPSKSEAQATQDVNFNSTTHNHRVNLSLIIHNFASGNV